MILQDGFGVSRRRAYLIEALMFISYVFFNASWFAASRLTPEIMAFFHLEEIPAAVNNAITVSKILGNFAAAWIFVRLRPKKAMAFAMGLVTLVILGAFTSSFPVYILSRFCMGFGGALIVVYFSPIVLFYFPPERRAPLNGLNTVSGPTGNALGLLAAVPLTALFQGNWRWTVGVFAAGSAVIFVLWLLFGQDFSVAAKAGEEERYGYREGFRDGFIYRYALCYTGWLMLFMFMANLFYLNPDGLANASQASWLVPLGGLASTPFAILAVKKLRRRLVTIRVCGVAITLLALFIMTTRSEAGCAVAAFALGFCAFLPITTFITIPQELPGMTPRRLSVVMALYWAFSYVFETVLYTILVLAINRWGFQGPQYAVAAISSLFCIMSFFLPETGAALPARAEADCPQPAKP